MELLIIVMLVLGAAAADSGSEENRVIGGKPCIVGSRPFQAALVINKHIYCGGSLVHPKWVLTATQCLSLLKSVKVHLGDYSLEKTEGTEQIRSIRNSFVHPGYNRHTFDNDFMLLELDRPVEINSNVRTIKLATSCPIPDTQCSLSGWGTTSSPKKNFPKYLQCADIPTISQNKCKATYGSLITENVFCAGVEKGGKDSCYGDSGGPLVCNGQLQGVVSWGNTVCGLPRQPGVYANVCKAAKWQKKGVHDDELVFHTFHEEERSTGVAAAKSFFPNGSLPVVHISSNPSIEIPPENKLVF
ncbi:anionic trypsin-like [Carettochelys insculpta]|uniref:anionic trypsin-like n=1 Tax=Carettochelys insculpta TaxID=44489 RepID=UPI003EC0A53B